MLKSLVICGGVLGIIITLSCGGSPPNLNIDPNSSGFYPGYKGGFSRDGYAGSENTTGLNPLWQLKLRYPLFDSPAIAGDHMFLPGIDKKIHVIDVKTGSEVAEIKLRRPIGTTPELADSFLAIGEEGPKSRLLVINYITGEILWTARTYRTCLSPALFDNKIFWVDGKNNINAAYIRNGELIWSINMDGGFDAGPVIAGDFVFLVTRDKHIYCLDIYNGKVAWDKIGAGNINGSPACYENYLYLCTAGGEVACYNCSDGMLLWIHKDQPRIFYSPAVDETGVYYGTGDGRFVKLDRASGKVLWEYTAGAPVRGTALVSRNSVFFASLDNTIFMLDKISGKALESYTAEGIISAAPVLLDKRLYIAAQDKFLYCFYMTGEK